MQITSEMVDLFSKEQLKVLIDNTQTIEQVCKRMYPTPLVGTSFEQYVDFEQLFNTDWVEILCKYPDRISKCTHSKNFDCIDVRKIIFEQPQLIDHFNVDNMFYADIYEFLLAYPHYYSKFNLSKLSPLQWSHLKQKFPDISVFQQDKPVNVNATWNILTCWRDRLYYFQSEDISYQFLQDAAYQLIITQYKEEHQNDEYVLMEDYNNGKRSFLICEPETIDIISDAYAHKKHITDVDYLLGKIDAIWHIAKKLSTQIITK